MRNRAYIEFLRYAQRVTRRADDAEDLLQSVLLAAIEAGRTDLSLHENRRWLLGALRKRALFDARSAVRRRRREGLQPVSDNASADEQPVPSHFISLLPAGLRTTALLALTGHTKAEICWLLHLTDATLRQRIASIKRRWREFGGQDFSEIPGLSGSLLYGQIRQALIKPVRHGQTLLASHDPDGNLFVLGSQNHGSRQQGNTPTQKEEQNHVQ